MPGPVPVRGSQAVSAAMAEIAASKNGNEDVKREPTPPRLVLWWESLETWKQIAVSFPAFAVFTFLLNVGPFYQPVDRSILYGLFEGGVLTGLMAIATRTERGRRKHDRR